MRGFHSARKTRRGVSELVATVLTISITLVAGFGVFGYVNSQAGVTENQYGQAVGQTVQYLEERFVVAEFAFSAGTLKIFVYNNGRVNLQIVQVEVYDSARSAIDVVYSATGATDLLHTGCSVSNPSTVENPVIGVLSNEFAVPTATALPLTLTLPNVSMNPSCPTSPGWTSGTAYYARITAQYGNQAVYYQVD